LSGLRRPKAIVLVSPNCGNLGSHWQMRQLGVSGN
jgi:hypothetical protein